MKKNNSGTVNNFLACLIAFLWLVLLPCDMYAQETLLVGQVMNKYDKSPLSSVDIYFKGTNIAVKSNEDGYFMIRTKGDETTVVFSLLGYKKEELKLKKGQEAGIQMELEEKQNFLDDILIIPGINPAKELMRNVRLKRSQNNLMASINSTEQKAVFLSKNDSGWQNNKLYEQFKSGNLSKNDSVLLVPLYMEESEYNHKGGKKQQFNKNTFNSSEVTENLIIKLLDGLDNRINFYENSVNVLGKSLVSPLANIGNTYYKYYLADSIQTTSGKQYEVHFYSKNLKNLAFNGKMGIDSATLALTYIKAELPHQANINFIHNLHIEQTYTLLGKSWIPEKEKSVWYMTYDLLKDSLNTKPELLVKKNALYSADKREIELKPDSFVNTAYSEEAIAERMNALQQTAMYKTAKFIADAVLTGYMKVGKIDIGKITTIARYTKPEGFRLGLPFRTNEDLWKNFMIGGFGAYGLGDKEWKYGGEMQWKLPMKSRFILGIQYSNDYKKTDYDYTDFFWREDALSSGDEDIGSTIFSLRQGISLNKKQEFSAFAIKDLSPDIESYLVYRNQKTFDSETLPFIHNGERLPYLNQQSISLTGRFSFGERAVDGHFQRFYQRSYSPVIYTTVEGGRFELNSQNSDYLRITTGIQQWGVFTLGEWRYLLNAGKIIGDVPYPLLKRLHGKGGGAYSRYQFAMMNYNEYIADTYADLNTELILNGVIFNYIPLVKQLNLREIFSYKIAYGSLSNKHTEWLDIPSGISGFTKPYSEVSAGICNLFGVATIQSIWRLSDLDKPNIKKWGVKLSLLISL